MFKFLNLGKQDRKHTFPFFKGADRPKHNRSHIITPNVEDITGTEYLDKLAKRDGWENILTGIGAQKMDKSTYTSAYWYPMPYEEAEAIYSSDALATKIIELPVDSALFNEFRLDLPEEKEEADTKFNTYIKKKLNKKFNIIATVREAAIWGRIFGGSYLVLGVDDGLRMQEPLDIKRIKTVKWIRNFDPHEVFPVLGGTNPNFENYLKPEFYSIASHGMGDVSAGLIHHTRIIRFDGKPILRRQFIANGYKNDSVLNPIKSMLANYHQAVSALGYMIQEWSVGILKMKGLETQIASNKEDVVMRRIGMIEKSKSIIRSIVIGDNDTYERMSGQYSGVENVAMFLRKELATHTNIPHTILFNEGPGGHGGFGGLTSGKGESEISDWQAYVSQYQKHYLKKNLTRLYEILLSAKDNEETKGKAPVFEIKFTASRQMTINEEADTYSALANADSAYLGMGVISPKEIRDTRFSEAGTFHNFQTKIQLNDATVLESTEQSPVETSYDPENEGNTETADEEGERAGTAENKPDKEGGKDEMSGPSALPDEPEDNPNKKKKNTEGEV